MSWSVVGLGLGSALVFLAGILAGRFLGADEYGRAAAVLFTSQFLLLIATAGFDTAALRTVPSERGARVFDLTRTATTAALSGATLVAVLIVLVGVVVSAEREYLLLAAVSLAFATRATFERIASALHRFRSQGLWKLAEGAGLLAACVAAGLLGFMTDHQTYLVMVSLAAVIVGLGLGASLRRYCWPPMAQRSALSTLAPFAGVSVAHAIAPAGYLFGDKFFVGTQLGPSALGIYTAAYLASYTAVAQGAAVLTNVLFPTVVGMQDKRPVFDRIGRLQLQAALPLFASLAVGITIVMTILGPTFQLPWTTVLMFAGWGCVFFFNALYDVLAISISRRTYVLTVGMQLVRSIAYLLYLAALAVADVQSIAYVVFGLFIGELGAMWFLRRLVKRGLAQPRAASS